MCIDIQMCKDTFTPLWESSQCLWVSAVFFSKSLMYAYDIFRRHLCVSDAKCQLYWRDLERSNPSFPLPPLPQIIIMWFTCTSFSFWKPTARACPACTEPLLGVHHCPCRRWLGEPWPQPGGCPRLVRGLGRPQVLLEVHLGGRVSPWWVFHAAWFI